jgi:hypothetical protein
MQLLKIAIKWCTTDVDMLNGEQLHRIQSSFTRFDFRLVNLILFLAFSALLFSFQFFSQFSFFPHVSLIFHPEI